MASAAPQPDEKERIRLEKPMTGEVFAALDLGTNNCRLLVARSMVPEPKTTQQLRIIDSFSKIVRLGEGVSQTGLLSEAAIERTIAALRMCKNKLDRHEVSHARYVATEACRRAQNSAEFLARVHRETGIEIDIISNEEEARLAFAGCASLLDASARHAIVFDIGGGSTEFLWVQLQPQADGAIKTHVKDWLSLPFGVMNLSEKFGGNSFAELYFDEMVNYLVGLLTPFDVANGIKQALKAEKVQMMSTSGTVTTLAAIHLDLPRYERSRIDGICLEQENICGASQKLLNMRASERFHHPCIGSDRTDFIISGCAIFEAIAKIWPNSHITIADRGVREGIILSFLQGGV